MRTLSLSLSVSLGVSRFPGCVSSSRCFAPNSVNLTSLVWLARDRVSRQVGWRGPYPAGLGMPIQQSKFALKGGLDTSCSALAKEEHFSVSPSSSSSHFWRRCAKAGSGMRFPFHISPQIADLNVPRQCTAADTNRKRQSVITSSH